MSRSELRRIRAPRHLCQHCRDRKARFRFRGVVRADRHHVLCFDCYRRELNRARARRLVDRTPRLQSPFAPYDGGSERVLNEHQLAHRQRMFDHLRRHGKLAS